MGRLEIRLCGARNIGDVQKVGTPDPYVIIKMGEKKDADYCKYKAPIVDNSLNPTWNTTYKFQVADANKAQIRFEVWNDNVFVDDLLGSYDLSLNGLYRGVVKDFWAIMTGTKLSSAELHLRILAVDFGMDPPPGEVITATIEGDGYVPPPVEDKKKKKKDGDQPASTVTYDPAAKPGQQQQQQAVVGQPVQYVQQQPIQYVQQQQQLPVQYVQQPVQYVQQQQQPQIQYVQPVQPVQYMQQQQQPQVQYIQPVQPVQYVQQQPQQQYYQQQPPYPQQYASPPPPQQYQYGPPPPQGYPPQGPPQPGYYPPQRF